MEKDSRLTTDEYLLSLACQVSKRSTCDRFRAGCVVAREGILLATGYNGSIDGEPHCDLVGHMLETTKLDLAAPVEHCIRTVHAEINCIINAASQGMVISKADWFVNGWPCWKCSKAIARLKPRRLIVLDVKGTVSVREGGDFYTMKDWWTDRFERERCLKRNPDMLFQRLCVFSSDKFEENLC